ncbi:enoyl-CoA hydratase/isomerase family protein [Pseudonocardia lacus]|uniref:enoyl-CoA hydratase/isomerase family protein n=1 Tax=Pseudonocardia lacus TaxID=2835865 RepID=UPI001BDD6DD4|nr:enoyl-CoA hydratase/isomerase family protein [Pseudonocardia lacus]
MLTIDRRDRWALLTLDRPRQRNALSIELRDAVSDALDDLAGDERVHGVAITGAGGTFSAGWDLREFERARTDPDLAARIWASGDRFHHTLLGFPLPLVAAVDGPALAGAFDLAVCCDVRLASTTARFAHPEFSWADVVYAPLEAAVGGAVARDLLLTGRPLDAGEALAVGLVSVVVEPGQLAAHLAGVMARIAAAPRDVLRRTKAKAVRRAAVDLAPTLQL